MHHRQNGDTLSTDVVDKGEGEPTENEAPNTALGRSLLRQLAESPEAALDFGHKLDS